MKMRWLVSVPGIGQGLDAAKHPLYMYTVYIQIYFQTGKLQIKSQSQRFP